MNKVIEILSNDKSKFSQGDWRPIKDFGFITIAEERNNTISWREIETEAGGRLLHRVNIEFDFPGLEGGSSEDLKSVFAFLKVGAGSVAPHDSIDKKLLKSQVTLDFDMENPVKVGDTLFVQAVTYLVYPNKDVALYAPLGSVKIIE
ncbi:MAG: hypothetical protein ACRERW_05275 [Pseudomonas sp.]